MIFSTFVLLNTIFFGISEYFLAHLHNFCSCFVCGKNQGEARFIKSAIFFIYFAPQIHTNSHFRRWYAINAISILCLVKCKFYLNFQSFKIYSLVDKTQHTLADTGTVQVCTVNRRMICFSLYVLRSFVFAPENSHLQNILCSGISWEITMFWVSIEKWAGEREREREKCTRSISKKPASPDQYFSWMNIQQHIVTSTTSRTQSQEMEKILFSAVLSHCVFIEDTRTFQNGRGKF